LPAGRLNITQSLKKIHPHTLKARIESMIKDSKKHIRKNWIPITARTVRYTFTELKWRRGILLNRVPKRKINATLLSQHHKSDLYKTAIKPRKPLEKKIGDDYENPHEIYSLIQKIKTYYQKGYRGPVESDDMLIITLTDAQAALARRMLENERDFELLKPEGERLFTDMGIPDVMTVKEWNTVKGRPEAKIMFVSLVRNAGWAMSALAGKTVYMPYRKIEDDTVIPRVFRVPRISKIERDQGRYLIRKAVDKAEEIRRGAKVPEEEEDVYIRAIYLDRLDWDNIEVKIGDAWYEPEFSEDINPHMDISDMNVEGLNELLDLRDRPMKHVKGKVSIQLLEDYEFLKEADKQASERMTEPAAVKRDIKLALEAMYNLPERSKVKELLLDNLDTISDYDELDKLIGSIDGVGKVTVDKIAQLLELPVKTKIRRRKKSGSGIIDAALSAVGDPDKDKSQLAMSPLWERLRKRLPGWKEGWLKKYFDVLMSIESVLFGVSMSAAFLINFIPGIDMNISLQSAAVLSSGIFTALHPRVYYDINAPPEEATLFNKLEIFTFAMFQSIPYVFFILNPTLLTAIVAVGAAIGWHILYNRVIVPYFGGVLALFITDAGDVLELEPLPADWTLKEYRINDIEIFEGQYVRVTVSKPGIVRAGRIKELTGEWKPYDDIPLEPQGDGKYHAVLNSYADEFTFRWDTPNGWEWEDLSERGDRNFRINKVPFKEEILRENWEYYSRRIKRSVRKINLRKRGSKAEKELVEYLDAAGMIIDKEIKDVAIESLYPVLKAVAQFDKTDRNTLLKILQRNEFESTIADAIMFMYDIIPAGWFEKNAAELKGKTIYSLSPENTLIAGGLGYVMQVHERFMMDLGAKVVAVEPRYKMRMNKEGEPELLDYAEEYLDSELEEIYSYKVTVGSTETLVRIMRGKNEQGKEVLLIEEVVDPSIQEALLYMITGDRYIFETDKRYLVEPGLLGLYKEALRLEEEGREGIIREHVEQNPDWFFSYFQHQIDRIPEGNPVRTDLENIIKSSYPLWDKYIQFMGFMGEMDRDRPRYTNMRLASEYMSRQEIEIFPDDMEQDLQTALKNLVKGNKYSFEDGRLADPGLLGLYNEALRLFHEGKTDLLYEHAQKDWFFNYIKFELEKLPDFNQVKNVLGFISNPATYETVPGDNRILAFEGTMYYLGLLQDIRAKFTNTVYAYRMFGNSAEEEFNAFFAKASKELLVREKSEFAWGNDAQSAAAMALLREEKDKGGVLKDIHLAFTTHTFGNRQEMDIYDENGFNRLEYIMNLIGLDKRYWSAFVRGDMMDMTSGAVNLADSVNTVSRKQKIVLERKGYDPDARYEAVTNGDELTRVRNKIKEIYKKLRGKKLKDIADLVWKDARDIVWRAVEMQNDQMGFDLEPKQPIASYAGRNIYEKISPFRAFTHDNIRKLVKAGKQIVLYSRIQSYPASEDMADGYKDLQAQIGCIDPEFVDTIVDFFMEKDGEILYSDLFRLIPEEKDGLKSRKWKYLETAMRRYTQDSTLESIDHDSFMNDLRQASAVLSLLKGIKPAFMGRVIRRAARKGSIESLGELLDLAGDDKKKARKLLKKEYGSQKEILSAVNSAVMFFANKHGGSEYSGQLEFVGQFEDSEKQLMLIASSMVVLDSDDKTGTCEFTEVNGAAAMSLILASPWILKASEYKDILGEGIIGEANIKGVNMVIPKDDSPDSYFEAINSTLDKANDKDEEVRKGFYGSLANSAKIAQILHGLNTAGLGYLRTWNNNMKNERLAKEDAVKLVESFIDELSGYEDEELYDLLKGILDAGRNDTTSFEFIMNPVAGGVTDGWHDESKGGLRAFIDKKQDIEKYLWDGTIPQLKSGDYNRYIEALLGSVKGSDKINEWLGLLYHSPDMGIRKKNEIFNYLLRRLTDRLGDLYDETDSRMLASSITMPSLEELVKKTEKLDEIFVGLPAEREFFRVIEPTADKVSKYDLGIERLEGYMRIRTLIELTGDTPEKISKKFIYERKIEKKTKNFVWFTDKVYETENPGEPVGQMLLEIKTGKDKREGRRFNISVAEKYIGKNSVNRILNYMWLTTGMQNMVTDMFEVNVMGSGPNPFAAKKLKNRGFVPDRSIDNLVKDVVSENISVETAKVNLSLDIDDNQEYDFDGKYYYYDLNTGGYYVFIEDEEGRFIEGADYYRNITSEQRKKHILEMHRQGRTLWGVMNYSRVVPITGVLTINDPIEKGLHSRPRQRIVSIKEKYPLTSITLTDSAGKTVVVDNNPFDIADLDVLEYNKKIWIEIDGPDAQKVLEELLLSNLNAADGLITDQQPADLKYKWKQVGGHELLELSEEDKKELIKEKLSESERAQEPILGAISRLSAYIHALNYSGITVIGTALLYFVYRLDLPVISVVSLAMILPFLFLWGPVNRYLNRQAFRVRQAYKNLEEVGGGFERALESREQTELIPELRRISNTKSSDEKVMYVDKEGKLWANKAILVQLPQDLQYSMLLHELNHYLGKGDILAYFNQAFNGFWNYNANFRSARAKEGLPENITIKNVINRTKKQVLSGLLKEDIPVDEEDSQDKYKRFINAAIASVMDNTVGDYFVRDLPYDFTSYAVKLSEYLYEPGRIRHLHEIRSLIEDDYESFVQYKNAVDMILIKFATLKNHLKDGNFVNLMQLDPQLYELYDSMYLVPDSNNPSDMLQKIGEYDAKITLRIEALIEKIKFQSRTSVEDAQDLAAGVREAITGKIEDGTVLWDPEDGQIKLHGRARMYFHTDRADYLVRKVKELSKIHSKIYRWLTGLLSLSKEEKLFSSAFKGEVTPESLPYQRTIVNTFPYIKNQHMYLADYFYSKKNRHLTYSYLDQVLEYMDLLGKGWRVGMNMPGSGASIIKYPHVHVFEDTTPIEKQTKREITQVADGKVKVSFVEDWPVDVWVLKSDDRRSLIDSVLDFTRSIQENGFTFNLYFNAQTDEIYVIPRRFTKEGLLVGFLEIAGQAIAKSEQEYRNLRSEQRWIEKIRKEGFETGESLTILPFKENLDNINMKLDRFAIFEEKANRILTEITAERRDIWKAHKRWPSAITVFGSARVKDETTPDYQQAMRLGELIFENGLTAKTGTGPGAAMEGSLKGYVDARTKLLRRVESGDIADSEELFNGYFKEINRLLDIIKKVPDEKDHNYEQTVDELVQRVKAMKTVGFNITVPWEQKPNDYVEEHYLSNHFITRKHALYENSKGIIIMPGGVGTIDEMFAVWEQGIPFVFMNEAFWKPILDSFYRAWRKMGIPEDKLPPMPEFVETPEDALAYILKESESRPPVKTSPQRMRQINEELKKGLMKFTELSSSVTIIGDPDIKRDSSEISLIKDVTSVLTEEGMPVEIGSRGALLDAVLNQADDKDLDMIYSDLYIPQGDRMTANEQRVKHSVVTTSLANHNIFLTVNSKAFIFAPGGISTQRKLFDIIDMMRTTKTPKKPIVLIGRDFWEPVIEMIYRQMRGYHVPTISENYFEMIKYADTRDDVLEALGMKQPSPEPVYIKNPVSKLINWIIDKYLPSYMFPKFPKYWTEEGSRELILDKKILEELDGLHGQVLERFKKAQKMPEEMVRAVGGLMQEISAKLAVMVESYNHVLSFLLGKEYAGMPREYTFEDIEGAIRYLGEYTIPALVEIETKYFHIRGLPSEWISNVDTIKRSISDILLAGMRSPSVDVRIESVKAAGAFKGSGLEVELIIQAGRTSTLPDVKAGALISLAELGSKEGGYLIEANIDNADDIIKKAALEAREILIKKIGAAEYKKIQYEDKVLYIPSDDEYHAFHLGNIGKIVEKTTLILTGMGIEIGNFKIGDVFKEVPKLLWVASRPVRIDQKENFRIIREALDELKHDDSIKDIISDIVLPENLSDPVKFLTTGEMKELGDLNMQLTLSDNPTAFEEKDQLFGYLEEMSDGSYDYTLQIDTLKMGVDFMKIAFKHEIFEIYAEKIGSMDAAKSHISALGKLSLEEQNILRNAVKEYLESSERAFDSLLMQIRVFQTNISDNNAVIRSLLKDIMSDGEEFFSDDNIEFILNYGSTIADTLEFILGIQDYHETVYGIELESDQIISLFRNTKSIAEVQLYYELLESCGITDGKEIELISGNLYASEVEDFIDYISGIKTGASADMEYHIKKWIDYKDGFWQDKALDFLLDTSYPEGFEDEEKQFAYIMKMAVALGRTESLKLRYKDLVINIFYKKIIRNGKPLFSEKQAENIYKLDYISKSHVLYQLFKRTIKNAGETGFQFTGYGIAEFLKRTRSSREALDFIEKLKLLGVEEEAHLVTILRASIVDDEKRRILPAVEFIKHLNAQGIYDGVDVARIIGEYRTLEDYRAATKSRKKDSDSKRQIINEEKKYLMYVIEKIKEGLNKDETADLLMSITRSGEPFFPKEKQKQVNSIAGIKHLPDVIDVLPRLVYDTIFTGPGEEFQFKPFSAVDLFTRNTTGLTAKTINEYIDFMMNKGIRKGARIVTIWRLMDFDEIADFMGYLKKAGIESGPQQYKTMVRFGNIAKYMDFLKDSDPQLYESIGRVDVKKYQKKDIAEQDVLRQYGKEDSAWQDKARAFLAEKSDPQDFEEEKKQFA
ncbi:LOG family protein, partial [Elusimicrobiota bacterium]